VARGTTDVVALSRADIDFSSIAVREIDELITAYEASAVVNCAAYTAVDQAETEEELATRINGSAVEVLARATAARSLPLVTFSTDYVFGGTSKRPYREDDPTDPVNAYGRSKSVGERLALSANPQTLVIRTSWVISGTHPNFVASILRRARAGMTLQVVDDQHGCPTVADDLATATVNALSRGASGLLHLTNQGATTWFHLAREAVDVAGLDPGQVSPCSSADYPTLARRPNYSVLDSSRGQGLGIDLPHWKESLPKLVERLLTWL
jgi:dTDP-4-dehydrorhamnose reductase